jgi:four helix bundle protein
MGQFGNDLMERVERAADRTIQMSLALPNNAAGWEIGRQIVRSAGSVGANIEEAQAVLSRKDFTYRMSVALREARETLYWMRRIERNQLLPASRLADLRSEWNELVSVLTASQKKLRDER